MACGGFCQCIHQVENDERVVSCYSGNFQESLELLQYRRLSMLALGTKLPFRLPRIQIWKCILYVRTCCIILLLLIMLFFFFLHFQTS